MRVLSLAFPPDAGGDDMQAAFNGFQQAMFRLRKKAGASPGPQRDGPSPGFISDI